jgi:predicted metal-dependent hydrolase
LAQQGEIQARVREWATRLDVQAHRIYIRPMRRKWASRSAAGTLSFNDDQIGMDRELGDHINVHELLYFFVPDRGKPNIFFTDTCSKMLGSDSKKKSLRAVRKSCRSVSPHPTTTGSSAPVSTLQGLLFSSI